MRTLRRSSAVGAIHALPLQRLTRVTPNPAQTGFRDLVAANLPVGFFRSLFRKHFTQLRWLVISCLISLLPLALTACQGGPRVQTGTPPSAEITSSPTSGAPAPTPSTPPTPVMAIQPVAIPDSPTQAPATQDTLQFVFPTVPPVPVSAWRPPLYPTPWAPTPYDHFFFSRPIGADVVNWPEADYRYGGVFFANVVHTGVDIPAPRHTPVLAAGSGKVTWAGYGLYALKFDPNDPYGLAVAIKHDFGYKGDTLFTIYGHMEKIFVTVGQYVHTGDVIGLVGDTGKVTGVHLHFEVREGKNNFYGSRNPELWMAPPQGWGVLAARVMGTSGQLLNHQSVEVHNLDSGQYWEVKTYGKGPVNSDPYYQENMVIGDLPAGNYEIWIGYLGTILNQRLRIRPGLVSYFTFKGRNGYIVGPPPTQGVDLLHPPGTLTPTP
jgi:murein DD-endopeptidase MepM/ murein hydrolase activator NlpD